MQIAADCLQRGEAFAIVSVSAAKGSTPREAGATMIVSLDRASGTIGGGRLEWDAMAAARSMLESGSNMRAISVALGPSIGQCCGGNVTIIVERGDEAGLAALVERERLASESLPQVIIYGAGHVGRALAEALALLPLRVTLTDSRSAELDLAQVPGINRLLSEAPVVVAEAAAANAAHVIMTHSHALDSLIACVILEKNRFSYLGIIGSRTKRTTFLKAFRAMGFADTVLKRITCPIGGAGLRDKRPQVIAAMTAAEIMIAISREDGG
jgi:xanthine dehydrogenase accessory factor/xanthine dehydrogenase large subunit